MTIFSFDPDNTLAGGLYAMTPREAIRLAVGLCEAVERSVGADGSHGAVWPGNVTASDGQVAVGPAADGTIAELSPDALEFVSPEQFWNGRVTPASDVYSIGLMLYTALNGGVMPFFDANAEHTPEARAYALQNRMKGAELSPPASAGRELADVVAKAIAFQADDRYAKPAALKLALESLPEGAAVPAVAPFMPMTDTELKNAHSYKVDKDFEKTAPEKPKKQPKRKREAGDVDEDMDAAEFRANPKKKNRWILPVVLVLLIAAALVLLLRGCRDYYDSDFPISTPAPSTTPAASQIHPPVPEETPVPVEPEETEPPQETDAPEETPDPDQPQYEIFLEDVTWEQAKAKCEEKGGHLATVKSADQLAEIIDLAQQKGATYVWLGAYRAENSHWYYVTGEALDYTVWDKGEPSAIDMDGTREDYLLLWYRKNQGTWSYNDMRNDPVSVAASYRGKLAYICQYY